MITALSKCFYLLTY